MKFPSLPRAHKAEPCGLTRSDCGMLQLRRPSHKVAGTSVNRVQSTELHCGGLASGLYDTLKPTSAFIISITRSAGHSFRVKY